MLRALFIVVLLANLVFWAWHHGPVAQALGLPQASDREPQRAAHQVNAAAVTLRPAAGAGGSATAGASANLWDARCVQTGVLELAQLSGAQQALRAAGLRDGDWAEWRQARAGEWAAYIGRFRSAQGAQLRADELAKQGQRWVVVDDGAFAIGLRLGLHATAEAARAELALLAGQRPRGARVVTLESPRMQAHLRVEPLTDAWRTALRPLTEMRWEPCSADGAAPSPSAPPVPASPATTPG